MTYIVNDGKTMIADCLVVERNTGTRTLGRLPTLENGYLDLHGQAKGVDVYYNDCHKIIFHPTATHEGKRIKTMAFAGSVGNVWDLLNALDAGVDLADWFKVEVNIQPVEERRLFNGETSMMFTLEDGEIFIARLRGKSIDLSNMRWAHLGSGIDAVNSANEFIPNRFKGENTELTALEAFAIACAHTNNVSRKFDYFIHATGEYKQNQELSTKQLKWILARVQKRMDLTRIYKDIQYANNIWGVKK
uniref:Phage protein n=1 Tax=Pseudomonas phage RVTF4 TaxID=3236931 RepID=A0AB39CCD6_9VIRU